MDDQIICREEIEGWRIFSGAISFREEIEGSWKFFSERTQPKVCFSIQQLKRAQRNAEMGFGGFVGGAGYGSFSEGLSTCRCCRLSKHLSELGPF